MSSIQDQKQLVFYNVAPETAVAQGYPKFNNGNHYLVDMSHLDPKKGDWMNTISIKLPNDNYVTLCVMQTSKDETCIDTAFHGDNLKDHRVFAMGGKGENHGDVNVYDKDIYALICHAKEIK